MRKRERTTMLINEAEVLEATHASLQVMMMMMVVVMIMSMIMFMTVTMLVTMTMLVMKYFRQKQQD